MENVGEFLRNKPPFSELFTKNLYTGCISRYVWCFSLSGFSPSTSSNNLESAWKKCGHDSITGDPNWQILTLNTPEGTLHPLGLLQKHLLSGFSSGVPNTFDGGTNLYMGI